MNATLAPVLLLAAVWAAGPGPAPRPVQEAKPHTLYWGLLVSGPSSEERPAEEMQAMQQRHLQNLSRLHQEGKGVLAGPLGETGSIRGIVVLDLETGIELGSEFRDDPFMEHGYLELRAYPWHLTTGKFVRTETSGSDLRLKSYSFGLVRARSEKEKELGLADVGTLEEALRDEVDPETQAPVLALGGTVDSDDLVCGVLVFLQDDLKKVRVCLDRIPEVAAGEVNVELHSLHCLGGILEAAGSPAAGDETGE